jgi:hypothetical protein
VHNTPVAQEPHPWMALRLLALTQMAPQQLQQQPVQR